MTEATTAAPAGAQPALLDVVDLRVSYASRRRTVDAVRDVTFAVAQGERVAIVGESGSGKSTIIRTVLGILPDSATTAGQVLLDGSDLLKADDRQWLDVRRTTIGFIPQDPQTSLDPTLTIGRQLGLIIRLKEHLDGDALQARVEQLLGEAGFDKPALRARQYPHELSGGLKQRALIAESLVGNPRLLVADEPTSALDVTVQKEILDRIDELVRAKGLALLMVTHDLAVAADRADRIVVMRNGEIVEQGTASAIIAHPRQRYTIDLFEAAPAHRLDEASAAGASASAAADTEAEEADDAATDATRNAAVRWHGVTKQFTLRHGQTRTATTADGSGARESRTFTAVDDVTLSAPRGETLAIVGESGSGKSTLLKIALGLEKPEHGYAEVNGVNITKTGGRALREARRTFQLVQQNPFGSLDPTKKISSIVAEPLNAFHEGDRASRRRRVAELIDRVALPANVLDAKPKELSGGQCQRVAIARALAIRPNTLFLDEPVSALDVTVQSQIIDLLIDLQHDLGLSYVFVTHDLSVVSQIAHRVAVIEHGRLVEQGPVGRVLTHPAHDYTKRLLASVPGHHR
ncbi:dipeptide ABC transporter ATP-binding protein [Bifidobacterium aesculapii]|uniref:dipeptide ABC transporter ATP-binding protein n=1 Tax=Bifidobacterium aesculapii TaxID=1329411 RepID=UPI0006E29DCE|nr:ABC transporter ATP-binding protein [Bifidobacterium aesculapii]